MADLSHLTDEQLSVYREMLASKNQPSQPQPKSGTDRMIENIPGSLYKAVTHPTFPGMPVGQGDATHPATFEDFKEKTLPKVIETVKHPLNAIKNSFIDDPVGAGLTAAAMGRGTFPNTAGALEGAVSGGARAAAGEVRPLLSRWSPFMHPAKMIPDLYDSAGNVIRGAKEGAFGPPKPSPFESRAVKTLPSSGGQAFNPKETGIEGTVIPHQATEELDPKLFNKFRDQQTPSVGGRSFDPVNTGITQPPFELTKPGPPMSKPVQKSLNVPNVSNLSDMPVGPTVKPVLPSGRRVPSAAPETLPSKPVTRQATQGPSNPAAPEIASHPVESNSSKVIYDENGKPLSYDDPVNGVNGSDLDIHKKIAQEGIEKRAADSRAKYEDVYQNIIKGNYSPDELRSLSTNPEAKTYLDLKIKDLKHPEGHPKAGHRKYGSGLDPQMVETLAKRLESENAQ